MLSTWNVYLNKIVCTWRTLKWNEIDVYQNSWKNHHKFIRKEFRSIFFNCLCVFFCCWSFLIFNIRQQYGNVYNLDTIHALRIFQTPKLSFHSFRFPFGINGFIYFIEWGHHHLIKFHPWCRKNIHVFLHVVISFSYIILPQTRFVCTLVLNKWLN